jgi:hypothetical protein
VSDPNYGKVLPFMDRDLFMCGTCRHTYVNEAEAAACVQSHTEIDHMPPLTHKFAKRYSLVTVRPEGDESYQELRESHDGEWCKYSFTETLQRDYLNAKLERDAAEMVVRMLVSAHEHQREPAESTWKAAKEISHRSINGLRGQ